jgi:hypothetical protein
VDELSIAFWKYVFLGYNEAVALSMAAQECNLPLEDAKVILARNNNDVVSETDS